MVKSPLYDLSHLLKIIISGVKSLTDVSTLKCATHSGAMHCLWNSLFVAVKSFGRVNNIPFRKRSESSCLLSPDSRCTKMLWSPPVCWTFSFHVGCFSCVAISGAGSRAVHWPFSCSVCVVLGVSCVAISGGGEDARVKHFPACSMLCESHWLFVRVELSCLSTQG